MKKAKALSITVPYNLADKLSEIGRNESKSVSAVVSEAVAVYCLKKEFEEARKEFSERARKKGIITGDDINRVIDEYRKERKKAKGNS